MTKEMTLSRLLPLALALMLIGLTAVWGAWLGARSGGEGQWPFALIAVLWPVLAWAGCHSRRYSRRGVRAGLVHSQSARPAQPAIVRLSASHTSASIAPVATSPETQRKPARERGAELAGAFKR